MARKKLSELLDETDRETAPLPTRKVTKTEAVRLTVAEGVTKPADGVAHIKKKGGEGRLPSSNGHASHVAPRQPVITSDLAGSVEDIKRLVEQLGAEQVISIARLFK